MVLLAPPLTFSHQELIGWAYIGVYSVLFYIFAISLLYASLQGIEGWLSSALRATGPLVAAPVALVFFGETLTVPQAVGALTVLITSSLIGKRDGKKKVEPS